MGAQGSLQGQLSVLLHFPLPEMFFNQLPWKWLQSGSVLSRPLPPTSTTAPSESSWKHFENLSYLERFHLFLSHAAEQSPLSLLPLMGWFLGCEQEESPVRGHGLSTEPSLALETRPVNIQGKSPSTPTICAQPGTRASTQLCSSTHRVLQCACKSCQVKSHKYSSKPGFGPLGMEGRDVTTFS